MLMAVLRKGGRTDERGTKAKRLGKALFGLLRQCGRVLPHPPTVADRCFRCAVTSVLLEKISRFLRDCTGSKLRETSVGNGRSHLEV